MNKFFQYFRFFLPAILWAGVIFAFSSYPTGTTTAIDWQDFVIKKLAHITEYAVFSVLLFRAFYNSGFSRTKSLKLALVVSILYGISDEFHQSFTPGREPRLRDVVFDTIGASLAAYGLWKYLPIAPSPLKRLAANYHLL